MKIKVILPFFPGFYESDPSDLIDRELEEYDSDEGFNYKKARESVAKGWCSAWSDEYEIEVDFVALHSPREYNFTTDSLEVEIDEVVLLALYSRCMGGDLSDLFNETLKEFFQDRPGFISHYPDSSTHPRWQLQRLDHNQWMAVIATYVKDHGREVNLDVPEIYEAAQGGWEISTI